MSQTYSAGYATAYGAAKQAGYTGTYSDFQTALLKYAEGGYVPEVGEDGYWYVDDVSTGVKAQGNGIASTILNADYTLTITFTDGTTWTSSSIRGATGETGATGATGATGNGIASIAKTSTSGLVDTYTITFTDSTTFTYTVTNGTASIDATLTLEDYAADAKATGDAITELNTNYTELKNATSQKKDFLGSDELWDQGHIDNGDDKNSTTRIRTCKYFPLDGVQSIEITPQSTYSFAVTWYTQAYAFISSSSQWETTKKIYTATDIPNTAKYVRVVLRKSNNGSITPSDKTNISGSITYVFGFNDLDGDTKSLANSAVHRVENVGLSNGTIENALNSNAVRTQYIECSYGDEIILYPVRPNTDGYYYSYGYRIFDSSLTTLEDKINNAVGYNDVTITQQNAAYIRFFIVEYNGSTYNALRYNTYGYTPYVVVKTGEALEDRIEAFENANIISETEFLNNAVWEQGTLNIGLPASSSTRIRTDFIEIGYASWISIRINAGYYYALDFYTPDKTFISSSPSWISETTYLSNSDFPNNTGYLKVVLRKSGNNADIVPIECVNIFGTICVMAEQMAQYLTKKADALLDDSPHYNDLLSQARFSPTANAKVLTLMHFSDIHDNLVAMNKAIEISETYSSKIDDLIHTGDVVLANFSDGLTNWINSGCAEKVISVIGNHDSEENLVLGTAGQSTVYNAMLAPYISNWGVVQPTGVDDSSSNYYCACYYYKDYTDVSIRLIVLDTNWWDDYEKTWLSDVLDDALTNSYAVILACHTPLRVTGLTNCNFTSYTEPTISESSAYANIPSNWLDPVDDFITNGGEVVCMLSGHNHRDHIGYLTDYPDVLCITADKASVARTIDSARITGEDNATAFNVLTFNTTDKWIKIVRIGAEVDGQMRGKHVFCYDYANKEIISQW